jgi:hypothetical protein
VVGQGEAGVVEGGWCGGAVGADDANERYIRVVLSLQITYLILLISANQSMIPPISCSNNIRESDISPSRAWMVFESITASQHSTPLHLISSHALLISITSALHI